MKLTTGGPLTLLGSSALPWKCLFSAMTKCCKEVSSDSYCFTGIPWLLERQKLLDSEDLMDLIYGELREIQIFLYSV